MVSILGFDNSALCYVPFVIATSLFYLTTLEHYYTLEMNFPILNGASEGAIMIGVF